MTNSDPSDTTLLLSARDGDLDAFTTLLLRHRPMLVALCRNMLGDEALAEDAAQEASLRAMLRLHTLEHPDRFGAWLAGIGMNVCRLLLRARSREYTTLTLLAYATDGAPGPESSALTSDLAARVRGAVGKLPQGQRSAVSLFYLSDLSYAETAKSLGIEVGAVRTRLHKARATLRRQLFEISQEDLHMEDKKKEYHCSFCNKGNEEVHRMIAGPNGVVICNECIDFCNGLLADEEAKSSA